VRQVGLYGAAATLALPFGALATLLHPGLRAQAGGRLTLSLPTVEPGAIWMHAASLGEGRAALALAHALSVERPEIPLLRTATSAAGVRQILDVDASWPLPLDAPFLIRRFLSRVRPRALVLVESELWPGLLEAARGRVPIIVLGARVGPGSKRFAERLPALFLELVRLPTAWSARDSEAAAFFEPYVGAMPVIGDLKAEAPLGEPALRWDRPCLVAGSTHPGDEAALLEAVSRLPDRPLLVLAPRHVGRFDEVADLLAARGERFVRRSHLSDGTVPADRDVVLLDSLGELAGLYRRADAAFVGGTFLPEMGGHSASEAASAGLPVVHGPHIHANRASFASLSTFLARSPELLPEAVALAMATPKCEALRSPTTGAALELLRPFLDAPIPPERAPRGLLLPLVPVYAGLSRLQRALRKPRRCALPVVAVGNLVSGGSGKTPVTLWLADRLRLLGHRPAILSRGWRRSADGPELREARSAVASAAFLGDEAALVARRGFLVVSCPDRARSATVAEARGATVLLLDDGLQQHDIEADVAICVLDARHPLGGGLLPAGDGREGREALARMQMVWVNHGALPPDLRRFLARDAIEVRASFLFDGFVAGPDLEPAGPLSPAPGEPLAAFAGVGRPEGFFRLLRRAGFTLGRTRRFPDHHRFPASDLRDLASWAAGLPLVSTEKDLVRLSELAFTPNVVAARVRLAIEEGEDGILALLGGFAPPASTGSAPSFGGLA
jgi:3-deoxy-D-manno-octulosonic-acid transferase